MSTYVADQKLESEVIDLQADFISRLAVGETALTCSSSISLLSGTDATPSTMLSGSPTVLNGVVTQQITGGIAGNIYTVWLSVRTSETNVLVNELKLAVLPDDASVPAIP